MFFFRIILIFLLLFLLKTQYSYSNNWALTSVLSNHKNCNKSSYQRFISKIYDIYFCYNNKFFTNFYEEDFTLILKYHSKLDKDKLINSLLQEIKKQNSIPLKLENKYLGIFNVIFPQIHPNDVISINYYKAGYSNFYYNSHFKLELENKVFVKDFFNIWIGKETSYPRIKEQLLRNIAKH